MVISLIVAMGKNRVIGADGGMPWHIPADLANFKRVTMGKPMIMGRKTYESIGKPLPGRRNMVVSRNRGLVVDGAECFVSLSAALDAISDADEIMIIGGGEIYRDALDLASRIYITEIDAAPEGDTFFPKLDMSDWRECSRQEVDPCAGTPGYAFIILERTD